MTSCGLQADQTFGILAHRVIECEASVHFLLEVVGELLGNFRIATGELLEAVFGVDVFSYRSRRLLGVENKGSLYLDTLVMECRLHLRATVHAMVFFEGVADLLDKPFFAGLAFGPCRFLFRPLVVGTLRYPQGSARSGRILGPKLRKRCKDETGRNSQKNYGYAVNKQPGRGLRIRESLLAEVGRTDWPSRA